MNENTAPSDKNHITTWVVVLLLILIVGGYFLMRTGQAHKTITLTEPVTFAYTVLPDAALAQVATANGYYLQEGLAATPQVHLIGKAALQAVLDGKADFATVAETPVMFSIMKGDKISIIATIDTSYKNMAVVARKNRGILTFRDLKGKKIATTFGTIGEFFMDSILVANGISRKDMKVVNLPPERLQDALANGDVDSISAWNPILIRTQKQLGDGGITFYGEDVYTQTFNVVAAQENIRRNPTKVIKMLRALIKAEEFIRNNPAEAQKIVADASQLDKALVGEIWAANNFRVALHQSLVIAMEDETRWAIRSNLTEEKKMPNYLDYIYFDGLESLKPGAVTITK
jgi:NitT/TauT family transport system substrate-binding protein